MSRRGRKGILNYKRWKSTRRAMKQIGKWNRNTWRRIVREAGQFYGADKVRSGANVLVDTSRLYSLVNPNMRGHGDMDRRFILLPRKVAEAFFKQHGCELVNNYHWYFGDTKNWNL